MLARSGQHHRANVWIGIYVLQRRDELADHAVAHRIAALGIVQDHVCQRPDTLDAHEGRRHHTVSTDTVVLTASRGTSVGHSDTTGRGRNGTPKAVPAPPNVHRCVASRRTTSASSGVRTLAATRRPTSLRSWAASGAVVPCRVLTPT